MPINTYCTSVSNDYKKLFEDCGVEFTDFIRTSEERHKLSVQHFWVFILFISVNLFIYLLNFIMSSE